MSHLYYLTVPEHVAYNFLDIVSKNVYGLGLSLYLIFGTAWRSHSVIRI